MSLGMPIAIALGLATTFGMLAGGYDLILIPQNMVSSVKSIELTAIPFFILAAALMNQLGITRKIFDFADVGGSLELAGGCHRVCSGTGQARAFIFRAWEAEGWVAIT